MVLKRVEVTPSSFLKNLFVYLSLKNIFDILKTQTLDLPHNPPNVYHLINTSWAFQKFNTEGISTPCQRNFGNFLETTELHLKSNQCG